MSLRRVAETVNLTSTGLWAGMIAMTAIAAAILFPTIRDLDPTLPQYAAYSGNHWRICAGKVGAKLFIVLDLAQVVLGTLALASLGYMLVKLGRRPAWAWLLRGVALGAALILVCVHVFLLAPRMNDHLVQYWDAALAGDNETAAVHQQAFSADHPLSSRLLTATFVAVTASLIAGAWCATGSPTERPANTPSAKPSRLEEPELLKASP